MAKPNAFRKRAKQRVRDVGTMWTMTRNDCTARCALLSRAADWELLLLIDGRPLLSTRGAAANDLLLTAEEWRARMIERGWTKVTPVLGRHATATGAA